MEDLYHRGVDSVKPTTITYNALINVWSKTRTEDSGDRAAYWLGKMEEDGEITPNDATYATVIDAYARCGNASKAEQILMKMIKNAKENGSDSCKPNNVCFSAAINAHAIVGKPRDAERLMNMMKKMCSEEGYEDLKPDPYCFNGVINAYIRSRESDRLERCLFLLDDMETHHVSTAVSYTAIIEGLAKTKQTFINGEHVGDIATKLLERMWELFQDGRESVMPTAVTYASVINLFAKTQRHDKAEHYLQELEKKYDELEYECLRPNTICFNACLSSFSKASSKDEALKAESILERMQERSDDTFLKPDSFTLTNVISAWANSNNPERAEAILNTMQAMYENGDVAMKPTTVSFGAVLHAWARAGNIERAEKIVEHMESLMHLEGFEEMRPNAVIYNILINCCARCGSPSAVKKAQGILDKMRKYKDAGYTLASPNIITYNSMLSALHRSGEDAYPEACKILQEIEMARTLDPSMTPTNVTYTTFLRILAKSKVPNKSIIAERILAEMEINPNDHKLFPNNLTYDAVLKVCGSLIAPDSSLQRHALVLAIKTITKMQQLPHIIPTSFTYKEFFTTLSKLTKGEELLKLIEKSFDDCTRAGVLDDKILGVLIKTTPKVFLQKLLKLDTNTNLHSVSIKDLPQNWSCNAKRSVTMKSQRTNEQIVHNTGRRKIKR
jgi:pentatricopeptide repeat domain (PPR motif)